MWYKTCRHHTDFHCWYDRHTQSLKSSLCGVTELCFGTKQVRLGVITTDGCKHAPRTICPSLVRHHGRWSILAYSSCTGTVDVTSHRGTSVLSASLVRGIVITGIYTRSVWTYCDFNQLWTVTFLPTECVPSKSWHGVTLYCFVIWSFPNNAVSHKKMVWPKNKTVEIVKRFMFWYLPPLKTCKVDRRKWPPGGPFLSHWGAEEEV